MRSVVHVVKTQAVAGAENHLFMLLPVLAARGWAVHLLNLYDKSQERMTDSYALRLDDMTRCGIQVHTLSVGGKADVKPLPGMVRIMKQIRPGLLHTHMPYADLFASLAGRMAGVPKVISSRHYDYSITPAELRRFSRYYWSVKRLQDAVIPISNRIADLCQQQEGWDPHAIHLVRYGCEDQRVDKATARRRIRSELQVPQDALLVGTVARLIDWKGHRYVIEAMAQIYQQHPDLYWLFAGEGPLRPALEELVEKRGLQNRIVFLGHREDVPTLMAAFDVLAHPTIAEGFGLVLLEAMIQETPIVASSTGALPEIVIDGETGALVPVRDAIALAGAIRDLVGDPGRRHTWGKEGRRRYEAFFSLDRMVEQTLDTYERVMAA